MSRPGRATLALVTAKRILTLPLYAVNCTAGFYLLAFSLAVLFGGPVGSELFSGDPRSSFMGYYRQARQ